MPHHPRVIPVLVCILMLAGTSAVEAQQQPVSTTPERARTLPRAEPNDHRRPAGRMVGGELVVELEAVDAAWYPRGPDGPRIVTPAFAEVGRAPQVPGPLIRTSAGTPVRVSVRNTLDRAITVRGLVDRASIELPAQLPEEAEPGDPRFFFADSLVIPPGETREARFTPADEVSSFYYGRRAAPEGGSVNGTFFPGNFGDEGLFLGGLVVDPPGESVPPPERVLLISRWGGREEPSTLSVTFKMMINGVSWPFTERLRYAVGDTVRWRLINTSVIEHPMHLHGFYFRVDARGDTDADSVYAPADRPLVVTDVMPDFSSLRLSWVPDRPGNWLFHCHLIRHSGALQQFAGEPAHDAAHAMAGLVMGITVEPAAGEAMPEPEPERIIHLWTARTPGVFGDEPALSFVAREDASAPPADTLVVPGTPLVLERGEPTEIVVHNRLAMPLSVHWHGLEVRSAYDGVAHWSGHPGATRPPIAPGDSAKVRLAPPRAGTFIYHIHGEAGHELTQGLYGPFLVLPEGEASDHERDRVFVLAARGAERDAPPVVNGREAPPPERFTPDQMYRLRFIHISPDAFSKRVRLLRDGEPVEWRPLAKDGADLPEAARAPLPAVVELGVGETFDAAWTPREPGAYALEVVTTHYSASGLGPTVQRVAFGVGEVSDEALAAAGRVEPPPAPPPSPLDTMLAIQLPEDRLRDLVGVYTSPGIPVDFTVTLGEGGLRMAVTGQEPRPLVPLSPTLFRWEDQRSVRVEVEREDGRPVLVVFDMRLKARTP
ncbi:MAG TPA: multicopper oxidase domain-containing protein [Longimicrobiales bacterium]|nr:multicopper oxidase domain-containing protein [Longimicrobiales bacterium]